MVSACLVMHACWFVDARIQSAAAGTIAEFVRIVKDKEGRVSVYCPRSQDICFGEYQPSPFPAKRTVSSRLKAPEGGLLLVYAVYGPNPNHNEHLSPDQALLTVTYDVRYMP